MLWSAKLNQMRLEGEPHNPACLVFAVSVVNARDKPAQRQHFLLVIGLHDMSIGRETAWALWGVSPIPDLIKIQPGHGRPEVAAAFASLAADRAAHGHPFVSIFRTNPFSSPLGNIYRNIVSAFPHSRVCLRCEYE